MSIFYFVCKAVRAILRKPALSCFLEQKIGRFERVDIRQLYCSFSILIFLYGFSGSAQQRDYAVHANIIYHFTKYIDWPSFKKTGDFVIAVAGNSALYDELKRSTKDKTVSGQKIVVKKLEDSSSSFAYHILFVGKDKNNRLRNIAVATSSSAVLIVSEMPGMALEGSCINFILENERLKLEINKANIERRGLNIANELLRLATIVN